MKPLLTLFCALLLCGCETVPVPPTPQPAHKPVAGTIKLIPTDNKLIDGFVGPVDLMPPVVDRSWTQMVTSFVSSEVQQSDAAITIAAMTLPDNASNYVWSVECSHDLIHWTVAMTNIVLEADTSVAFYNLDGDQNFWRMKGTAL